MKKIMLLVLLATALSAEYIPFKVKLNMYDRMVVETLLPKEANFVTLKILNDLRMELSPTAEELKAINIRQNPEGTGIIGDWDKVPEKEIVFYELTEKAVVDALKKLDSESKLLAEHLSIYQKFVMREDGK